MMDKTTKQIYVYTKIPCYNTFHRNNKRVQNTVNKIEFNYPFDTKQDFLYKLFSFS
jgi:hypothetical protein